MAIYGESLTIQYIAWDTVNNAPKTGDAANHTLRWVKDGVAVAPTNAPSEVDAVNAPGVYKVTLTATETQCWVGTLCGKSATSGVVIMPVTLTFERLPTAAPGSSGGLPVIGAAPLTNLDAAVSSRLAAAAYTAPDNSSIAAIKAKTDQLQFVGTDVKATLDGEQVIVATNLDKTGYSLTADYDRAKTALAVSEYTAPDNTGIAAIKAQTDKLSFAGTGPYDVKATLDGEQVTVATNLDKSGYSLTSDYDRAKNALSYTEYTAPDNAGIAAIKAQTDKLTFDANNYVYATATVDEQAIADAVIAAIGDEQLVQVIVTPLSVRTQTTSSPGDAIKLWQHSKVRASFALDSDLSGHDLRFIIYRADTLQKLTECSGSEIAITAQSGGSLVAVEAADTKMPAPGRYRYLLRDQTTDDVVTAGDFYVSDAPDAA